MPKGISKAKQKLKGRKGENTFPPSPSSTLDKWIVRDRNRASYLSQRTADNVTINKEKTFQSDITKSNSPILTKTDSNKDQVKKTKNPKAVESTSKTKKTNKGEEKKTNSRSVRRHPSGSFLKYGVILPTYEEALLHKQKLEEFKQAIDDFDLSNDSIENITFELEEPKPVEILDCTHLTDEELTKELELNYQYLYNIVHGISKSERHDIFTRAQHKTGTKTDGLAYNTSMITFTYEQKRLLLKFLSKEFGNDTQYFFKVLLPELCTKIFMDTHNMTYNEAMAYLEIRPCKPID